MTNDDMELVREYGRSNSEAAFAALVSRHLNLVYSVALRQTRDPHLAEEVTQAVFIVFARKAKSLGEKTILSGWLCRAAQYASADALKVRRRRQFREREAHLQSTSQEPSPDVWAQIGPLLDLAMAQLGDKDHRAVVLRFFENKSLEEVGAALGTSKDAAKMRVSRALERLRVFLQRRGVDSTATAIAEAVVANSVQAAPPALATVVTSTALAESAVASGTTLTLVKGVLRIMAWTKAKIMVAVGAGVMLAAGTATMLVEHHLQGAGGHRPNSSFHAKGKVQFQFFQDNTNTVLARGARTFEVDVEGQRWAITARAVPDDGHPDEMTCDGLYTYATITGLATSRNPPSFPNISAQIKKDAVPFSSAGHAVECVWLSFASAGYLNSEKKGLFSPAWLEVNRTESALLGDRFHTEVVRLQNQPRLPKSIDCRANGFIWGASGLDKHALAPPFNAGYPCFTFRVNSVTNVAGMRIPTASALDVFYPHPGGTNAEDVVLGLHVELTAEQVEPATKRAEWQPPLGTRTQIKDFRFVKRSSDSRPVTYDVDGDRWPRESAPIVIAARQHQGRSAWWRKLFWLWNCWSSGVEARPV